MTAASGSVGHVRVLAEVSGIPLTDAELSAAAARVDAKRAELLPLHLLAAALPAGAGSALFRAGELDG